jgi:hypothetical protein
MKRFATWLIGFVIAALTLAPLASCRPDPVFAAIVKPGVGLSATALGDTLKLRSNWRALGTFDSAIVTYTSTRFATIRKAWPASRLADTSFAIPVPPLNPGDVVTVTASFAIKIGVTVTPSGSISAGYTQPGLIPDSLRVVGIDLRPSTAQLALRVVHPDDTVQFCAFARMADGRKSRTTASIGPQCDALWASYQTEAQS